MNRIGIALAADSAVSIGQAADKIYTSADKLFHLSESAPVAVMINGNANYLGVPWETIIKSFRSELAGERFDYLEQYSEKFLAYLKSNRTIFPVSLQQRYAVMLGVSLLADIRDQLKRTLDSEAEARDGLEESDIPPIIEKIVRDRLEIIRERKRLKEFTGTTSTQLRKKLSPEITDIKKHLFGNLKLTSAASRGLTNIVLEALQRQYFGPFQAGIVFAGFGEKDYMPKLVAHAIEGMVLNRPRLYETENEAITDDNTAAILPFAQQEMVHSFLRGIDPSLSGFFKTSTGELFRGVIESILGVVAQSDAKLGKTLDTAVSPEIDKLLGTLYDEWEKKSSEYWHPIVQITSSLPKDELASMAEALVNLTKFRRRISAERETVGGPIDVAVITKGDGFVWVKRKHYFDPNLNPRVIARYGNEGS